MTQIVEEVAVTAEHASPIVRVLVVEQEMSRRTIVQPFSDFLEGRKPRESIAKIFVVTTSTVLYKTRKKLVPNEKRKTINMKLLPR